MGDFEDLFGVIIVIAAIVGNVMKQKNKSKSKKAMQQVFDRPAKPKQALEQTMMEWFDQPRPEAKTSAPVEKSVAQPQVEVSVAVQGQPVVGSLGEDTHEGVHPCDDHDVAPMEDPRPVRPRPAAQPALQLDWTGDSLVKAFVMQEVLTRPSQRRRA